MALWLVLFSSELVDDLPCSLTVIFIFKHFLAAKRVLRRVYNLVQNFSIVSESFKESWVPAQWVVCL